MPGAPRNSFKAKLPLIIFGGMLVFTLGLGAVWLYGVLAPLNNWPDIQWPEKEGTQ